MCRMIIIFNEVLDLAPPVELIFNMGLMASQWPQSLWPPDEPIGLRCINNYQRDPGCAKITIESIIIAREPCRGIPFLRLRPGSNIELYMCRIKCK